MAFLGRLVAKAFRRLSDAGWSRGTKGSGVWMATAIVIAGVRFMVKLGSRKRDVVFSEELRPGEAMKVLHLLEDRLGRPAK